MDYTNSVAVIWSEKMKIIVLIAIILLLTGCGGNTMKTAVLETNQGIIKIELDQEMPITTKNFVDLAEKGYYDGTKFHRVISKFMIQGGDPLTKDDSKKHLWGTGGPGYDIKDEFGAMGNDRGTIAMANAGPNTGGSQFFINLVGNNFLDTKHPVFGKVVEGMDVVDKIAKVRTNSQDQPSEDVVITKVTIE
jgi:peptidylprolyl isomerase